MDASEKIKNALHELHSIGTDEFWDQSGYLSEAILALDNCVRKDLGEETGIEIIIDEDSFEYKVRETAKELAEILHQTNEPNVFTKLDELLWDAKTREYSELVSSGVEAQLQYLCEAAYDEDTLRFIKDEILDELDIDVEVENES